MKKRGVAAKAVVHCVGSKPHFHPEARCNDAGALEEARRRLDVDDFAGAIRSFFRIPTGDDYVYHALMSIRLDEAQTSVEMGARNGLHAWYSSDNGQPLPPPPRADIDAYTCIFEPSKSAVSALKSLLANAKKDSLRLSVAIHLTGKRFVHPSHLSTVTIPKRKTPSSSVPANPYLDFWAWSCRNLEWCGPLAATERTHMSHHVLPVLMHHFGCAVPSHEALEVLRVLCAGRTVVDAGSGNGYWSFMLRRYGVRTVAVDNEQSLWRTMWIGDTVVGDAVDWLRGREGRGGRDAVLMLVYPVVGPDDKGAFTRSLLAAYEGGTVAVVGSQNHNGYTGFATMTMDEFMEQDGLHGEDGNGIHGSTKSPWVRVLQVPLPSFAGKDEALYVFKRAHTTSLLGSDAS